MRPDSEFGARFEKLVQQQIRKHPGVGAEQWAKGYRLVREASHAKILTVGQVAFYASDQLANSMVGNLSWSIRGRGQPQDLGSFDASCSDLRTDSNALYRNVALRDEFASTSKELWQFPGWSKAVTSAVTAFEGCDSTYLMRLGTQVKGDWADKKAAAVVAAALAHLVTSERRGPERAVVRTRWDIGRGCEWDCALGGPWRVPGRMDDLDVVQRRLRDDVATSGRGIRLDVHQVYVQDENGQKGPPDQMESVSVGSFFLMWAVPDQAAKTELHNDDGVVHGANGLGNPFLCRTGARRQTRACVAPEREGRRGWLKWTGSRPQAEDHRPRTAAHFLFPCPADWPKGVRAGPGRPRCRSAL